jgi:hypothetical protein
MFRGETICAKVKRLSGTTGYVYVIRILSYILRRSGRE